MKAIVLLAFSVFLLSCGGKVYSGKTDPCTTSVTGDTVVLSYRKSIQVFQKCYDNMNATVTNILDSRCPQGVQCVWAGTVSVVLELDEHFQISLEAGKQIDTTYNQRKFSFTLIDVLPYPVSGNATPTNGVKAIVRITKS